MIRRMLFFLTRSGSGGARFLDWKIRFFVVGAALAFAGIYLEKFWLVTVAVVALISGAALRFVGAGTSDDIGEAEDEA